MLYEIDTSHLDHIYLSTKFDSFNFFASDDWKNVTFVYTNNLIGWMLTGLILIGLLFIDLINKGSSFMIARR